MADSDILDVRQSVIEAIRAALAHTDGNVVLSQEAAMSLVAEWDGRPSRNKPKRHSPVSNWGSSGYIAVLPKEKSNG